jgi:hypothetical protein
MKLSECLKEGFLGNVLSLVAIPEKVAGSAN